MNRSRCAIRASLAVATTLAASVLYAPNAFAVVEKSGSKSCGYQQYVTIVSKGNGTIKHYVGSTLKATYYHSNSTLFVDTTGTGRNSTSWKVTSTGGLLDDSGTYATCSPSTAPAP